MIDFKHLKDTYQSRRRPFISLGVLCLLALGLVVGLGYWRSQEVGRAPQPSPSASPLTGRDLWRRALASPPAATPQPVAAPTQPLKAAPQSTATPTQPVKAAPQPKATLAQPVKATPQPTATPQPPAAAAPPAPTSTPRGPSILDEPWPPSSHQGTTHVESTFLPRLGSMFFVLCFTCALIWIALKVAGPLLNRWGGSSPKAESRLQVLEHKTLGPNKALYLVEVAGERLLLGMTDQQITTLAHLQPPPAPSPTPAQTEPAPEALPEPEKEGEKPTPPPNLLQEVVKNHLSSLSWSKINNHPL